MTLPEAPGVLLFEHTQATPLAFLRYTRDPGRFGWYLIERRSRCLVNVSGPYEGRAAAGEAARTLAATWAEAAAARQARLRERSATRQG